MALKKGDFVELDFIGKVSATDMVFDSTIEAKKPAIICIGAGMILKSLDEKIEGKSIGDEFEVELKPDAAFGARNPQLMQLTSINAFRKQNVNPVPGLQLNIDGVLATVRSVSGGRVTLDFNHPLAGKAVKFWIKLKKQITDLSEELKVLCDGLNPEVKLKEKEIEISVDRKIPEKAAEIKVLQLKKLIPEINNHNIKFTTREKEKPVSEAPK